MVIKKDSYRLMEHNSNSLAVPTRNGKPLSPVNTDAVLDLSCSPTNNSPSPPAEKKKLKRWSPLSWVKSGSSSDTKKSQDGDVSPKPILRSGKRTFSGSSKHVGFRGQVKVHQWDEEGQHVSTEDDKLCAEPKDREAFLHRNMMRIMAKENLENGGTDYLTVTPDTSTSEAEVNLTFIPDTAKGLTMKMVVSVGSRFKPDDLCVKANMSGNRIRIMANKESLNEEGKMEAFNERFSLPITVDPYAVQARLDLRGNLTIEAPIVNENDKKNSLTLDSNVSY